MVRLGVDMGEEFDPYLHWLGIRDPQRPPNYYRLLGIELFESDPEVITNAADRQMAHVRTFQTGKHSAFSQKILNELAAAKICLLNPERKAQYDAQLLAQQAAQQSMPPLTAIPVGGQPPPGGLWPLNPPSVQVEPPPPEPEFPETEAVRPWFSLIATTLVAVILVLIGLIVAVLVQRREQPSGPLGESSILSPEEHTPTPPSPTETPPGQEKAKPPPKQVPVEKPTPPEPKSLPPARESLQEVRQALARRDIASAQQFLDFAQRKAPIGSSEADEVARLHLVCSALEEFWRAVAEALQELRPGEKIVVDIPGYIGFSPGDRQKLPPGEKIFVGLELLVKAVSPDRVQVENYGRVHSFTMKTMPIRLALALAQRKLPDHPSALLNQAAALLFDPQAEPAEAEALIQQAIEKKVAQAELFAEELKLAQSARSSVSAKEPGPSEKPLEKPPEPSPPSQPEVPAKPTPSRHPVPDPETQEKMLAEIRQIFDREYKSATKLEEKAKLADTLFRQGKETLDHPSAQYMLFVEARNLALEVGRGDILEQSIRRTAENFEVDLIQNAVEVFEEAAKRSRSAAANKIAAQSALVFAQEAFTQDKLDQAIRLAQLANELARKATDSLTIKKAVALRRQFEDFKPRYEAFVQAGKQLQTNPDDPEANLSYGSYLCFAKDEWQAGLRHLAKGKDPTLKALAEAELSAPRQHSEMLALGDKWWQASESVGNATLKEAYRTRAAYWYRRVQRYVSGLTKTRVERRLQELAQ